jgi:hypothetical protein
MRKIAKLLLLSLLFFCLSATLYAQKKTPAGKAQTKTVTKPPPPPVETQDLPPEVEKLEEALIDTAALNNMSIAFDSTAAPDDELTREIKRMLTVTEVVKTGLSIAEQHITAQQSANTDAVSQEFIGRFLKALKTGRVYNLFENMFVKMYRGHFSVDEIRKLTEFYQTSLGKKTLDILPQLMQQGQEAGENLGRFLGIEILKEMAKENTLK